MSVLDSYDFIQWVIFLFAWFIANKIILIINRILTHSQLWSFLSSYFSQRSKLDGLQNCGDLLDRSYRKLIMTRMFDVWDRKWRNFIGDSTDFWLPLCIYFIYNLKTITIYYYFMDNFSGCHKLWLTFTSDIKNHWVQSSLHK